MLPHHLLEMPDAMLAPSCSVMGINHQLAGLIADRVQPTLHTLDEPKIFAYHTISQLYCFMLRRVRLVGIQVKIENLCCLPR